MVHALQPQGGGTAAASASAMLPGASRFLGESIVTLLDNSLAAPGAFSSFMPHVPRFTWPLYLLLPRRQ
jgi:hypothetical protein